MPIKKSAFKELRKVKRRTIANDVVRASIRKDVKGVRKAITEKAADAVALMNAARKTLAKAAQKGVIHRNKAARLISRIEKKIKATTQPATK